MIEFISNKNNIPSESEEIETDINNKDIYLYTAISNLKQIISSEFEQRIAGLTIAQFIILHAIRLHEHPCQRDITDYTGIDRSTVADVMRRMEAKKYIVRTRLPSNARTYYITLTEKGTMELDYGVEIMKGVEKDIMPLLKAGCFNLNIQKFVSDYKSKFNKG